MPGIKLAFALAATAYASGKYLFGGKDNNPPRDASTLVAAAYAIGNYFFGGKDDDARDSYSASTFVAEVYTFGKRFFGGKNDDTPRDSYSTSTFVAAAYTFGKRFFGGKDDDPRDSYSATVVATTYAIGKYLFGRRDNGPPPPPRDPYYSTSFYNSRTQTQQSYGPPPQSHPTLIDHHQPMFTARPHLGPPHILTVVTRTRLSSTPGALAVVEDLEFSKKLREKARCSGWEMAEAYCQARSEQRMGNCWASLEYRQRGDAHKSTMEELDKRAARIIFKENNKDRKNGGKIDLHGLYVAEAVGFANQLLQYGESRGVQVMCFIVGESFDKPYRMCA
ncbi:hypothetical protein EDB87DRAFT_1576313 [Lactarius vividus]|nr:hypothetical protein EDB87DRAFT_1576313 [Lactarius vividus]